MLPLSDGIPARRFPIVNVLLSVANFAVFIFYELPHLNAAVSHASFYPCSVEGACRAPEAEGASLDHRHVPARSGLLARAGPAAPREQWRSTA
jgi:hypothetical protein